MYQQAHVYNNINTVLFFIYMRVYAATRKPIVKVSQAKMESNEPNNNNNNNNNNNEDSDRNASFGLSRRYILVCKPPSVSCTVLETGYEKP
jgi:hypothetical protein